MPHPHVQRQLFEKGNNMADVQKKAKGGKKNRKYGRNARYCELYRVRHQRERNKVKRLLRHLKRFPKDRCAGDSLARCYDVLGIRTAA